MWNEDWPQIPDHPYRILIIGGSGSGKTHYLKNSFFNLINHQPDVVKKREDIETKHFNDSKAFIKYVNDIDDI